MRCNRIEIIKEREPRAKPRENMGMEGRAGRKGREKRIRGRRGGRRNTSYQIIRGMKVVWDRYTAKKKQSFKSFKKASSR